MAIENRVGFTEQGTIRCCTDPIAKAVAGVMQKGCAEKAIAVGEPSDINQIIHSTGHDRIDRTAVGMSTVQVGCFAFPSLLGKYFVGLLGKGGFGPIDPAVGS